MILIKLINNTWPPQNGQYKNALTLHYDNWNDYGYLTSFGMSFCDDSGNVHEVGSVKILHIIKTCKNFFRTNTKMYSQD